MKLSNLVTTSALLFAAVLLNPVPAQAANTTCANREFLLVGTTASHSIASGTSAFFGTRLQAGRSYTVLSWTPFHDASEGLGGTDIVIYSNTACTTTVGPSDVQSEEPWLASIADAVDLEAQALIPSTTGEHVIQVSNAGISNTHRTVIFETSIYSPWWFTGGSNNAFITISNRSNVTNAVVVTMNSSTGSQCGTTTVSIPANGNTFVRVNDFSTCVTAAFGSAQLAFLGTPGTIQANITVIDAVQGVSFDEPFVPRFGFLIER